MFCPKCGDELIELDGELACLRGKMFLSQSLSRRLSECYELQSRPPQEKPFSFPIGGTWCCPACAARIVEGEKGVLRCSGCGRWLNEFIYELIERSSHDNLEL